ncbi:MAG: hypothetical protein M1829_002413 [Trizodia sp. TS-e1964]|nr:MAG: hypothetical protein M1829_002413 [Trizodia sp. TS-e1964]
MTRATSSTASSSIRGRSPDERRVIRKRNRLPLSCAPCRHRKLKCNRTQPCSNCVKRGDSYLCTYAAPSIRKKNQTSGGFSSPDDMQNRIDRLEGLVLSLMTNGPAAAGPSAALSALSAGTEPETPGNLTHTPLDPSISDYPAGDPETDQVTSSFGFMRIDNKKSMYVGSAHWAEILSDVQEIKSYWTEHKKHFEEQAVIHEKSQQEDRRNNPTPTYLFSISNPPPYSDIKSALPSKPAVDNLVARYFNSYDPSIHIIHGPTFQKDYAAFWTDQTGDCPVWLGLLFSIMCLAMHSYSQCDDEPAEYRGRVNELCNAYRTRTVHCLMLADITKPVPRMLETLIMHLNAEYLRSSDNEVGVWVMIGIIARLAMRMGYHRDPAPYPLITPFQGEMRRRVWTFIRQADLVFSFNVGLPSVIRSGDCDTKLPRNIYDNEFDESTSELPLPRPNDEPTPVSFMVNKARLAFVFGKIIEQSNSLREGSYEQIMKLDTELREAQAEIPPHLRMRSIDESLTDPANIIMQRFSLDLLYHKGHCVLHRKFLGLARTNPKYSHSRRSCVDSAMVLLSHHASLHTETKGRLRSVHWFVPYLITHDFLLAAMIVSLDLYCGTRGNQSSQISGDVDTWGLERKPCLKNRVQEQCLRTSEGGARSVFNSQLGHSAAEMISALDVSRNIWKELSDESLIAYKASEMLTVMLKSLDGLNRTVPLHGTINLDQRATSSFPHTRPARKDPMEISEEESKPEHSAAMTLGMMSSGGLTPNTASFFSNQQFGLLSPPMNMNPATNVLEEHTSDQDISFMGGPGSSPFPFMGPSGTSMMDISTNLDWDAWDSYFQGPTGFDTPSQTWQSLADAPYPVPAQASRHFSQQGPYNNDGSFYIADDQTQKNTLS